MLLKDIKELQFMLDVYNKYMKDETDMTPVVLMKKILESVNDNVEVLFEKYSTDSYRFTIKSWHWPPVGYNFIESNKDYPLQKLKIVKNQGEYSIRFLYELNSSGGFCPSNVVRLYKEE